MSFVLTAAAALSLLGLRIARTPGRTSLPDHALSAPALSSQSRLVGSVAIGGGSGPCLSVHSFTEVRSSSPDCGANGENAGVTLDCGENATGVALDCGAKVEVIAHLVFDIDPVERTNMSVLIASDFTQAAPHRVCLNEDAS